MSKSTDLRASARSTSMRWDIQGLRAFAVLAVVADHLFHYPRGGFVGVDIFFVISGFLISSHLVHQAETSGIMWLEFYRKRIKRILPAAVLVLVATTAASYVALSAARADSVRIDSVWALLFGANFRMLGTETDYFNATGTSPVQHYWSLSIEEQFYFVWPLLLLFIYAVFRRIAERHQRLAAGVTMGVIVGASFVWAVAQTSNNPTAAYFSTWARIWELGVGALLAVCVPLLVRIPVAVRVPLAWVGLAGMVSALWVVEPGRGFPAPWAALPVAATALVIAAGTYADRTRQQPFLFPLTNPVAKYIGDISYSLYLWHFPIIILGIATWGDSAGVKSALLVAIAIVSVYAYHLWEDPVRRSSWLEATPRGRRRQRQAVSRRYQFTALSAMAVVTTALVAASLRPVEPPKSAIETLGATSDAIADATGGQEQSPEAAKLAGEIHEALQATNWPSLRPSMDDSIGGKFAADEVHGCGSAAKEFDPESCTWGAADASHTMVVTGDSIAIGYMQPLIDTVAHRPDWRLISYATFDCTFIWDELKNSTGNEDDCRRRKVAAASAIKQLKPDVLVIGNLYSVKPKAGDAEDDVMTESEYVASAMKLVGPLKDAVGRFVFLSAPPQVTNPADCFTPSSSPADCASEIPSWWSARARADQSLARELSGVWIDTRGWYCWSGLCPPFVGRTPVRVDTVHLTLPYQERIVPVMGEALEAAAVWGA